MSWALPDESGDVVGRGSYIGRTRGASFAVLETAIILIRPLIGVSRMNIEYVFLSIFFLLYLQTIRVGVLGGLLLLYLFSCLFFIAAPNSLMTFNVE